MTKRQKGFRDPKIYVLSGLLLLLLFVNLQRWTKSSAPVNRSTQPRKEAESSAQRDPLLLAEQLNAERDEFHQEKRNIFSFFEPSPPPLQTRFAEPPPQPDPVCGNGSCEGGEDPATCPDDCQPPPPPAPVITLRYIGYLNEQEGSVAFLTDGREVYMGRVNDVIANQYRVLKITEDSVELGFLNNNQSSTIRFQGNQGG